MVVTEYPNADEKVKAVLGTDTLRYAVDEPTEAEEYEDRREAYINKKLTQAEQLVSQVATMNSSVGQGLPQGIQWEDVTNKDDFVDAIIYKFLSLVTEQIPDENQRKEAVAFDRKSMNLLGMIRVEVGDIRGSYVTGARRMTY